MLGFTLSKLNLLILVTAIFVILVFFMFGLSKVVVAETAQQMVGGYATTAFSLLSADTICAETSIKIPNEISFSGSRFFYKLYIAEILPDDETGLSTLIFSIANRKDSTNRIAATSFDTRATLKIFHWGGATDPTPTWIGELPDDEIRAAILDPQSTPPRIDVFYIIKEVYEGVPYLYIIPCTSEGSGICVANIQSVGCKLHGERGKMSSCIPVSPDEC